MKDNPQRIKDGEWIKSCPIWFMKHIELERIPVQLCEVCGRNLSHSYDPSIYDYEAKPEFKGICQNCAAP